MEGNIDLHLDLPPETSNYIFRIGGHTHVQDKLRLGTLKHKNGSILKPLIDGDTRSTRELSFYMQIFKNSDLDPILCELKSFLPSFNGTWETTLNGKDIKYLCIEDVCERFQNPSLLNVKIGVNVVEPTATKEKIEKEKKKYPPVEIIGFRILGMQVFDHWRQTYRSLNKKFGLNLTPETVNAGIGMFFNRQLGQINCLILSALLHQLLQIKSWFSRQRKFLFISSSLLMVYEGSLPSWTAWLDSCHIHIAYTDRCKKHDESSSKEFIEFHNEDCNPVFPSKFHGIDKELEDVCEDCKLHKTMCMKLQKDSKLFRVSLIDFAHVLPTTEEDSNYISGLNNFIAHLQILQSTYFETFYKCSTL